MPASPLPDRPLVLCISGHDPGGGAGIQADIEAVAAQGGRALSIITALTVQDTRDVARVDDVDARLIERQLDCLLADSRPAAIKLGLLGSADQAGVIAAAIERTGASVVIDPVLRAGGGSSLSSAATTRALLDQLFPLADVITPNAAEARILSGCGTRDAGATALLGTGCRNVLVTGGDEPGPSVENTWYRHDTEPGRYTWPRLAGGFHGAGCTLAAALAARLALGETMADALREAQRYTHAALASAVATGRGRLIPGRY